MSNKKQRGKKSATAKFWVGIGASAGGLEALRGFARNLPKGVDATFIVAQHMAPHHRSLLSEIIGRETSLPVRDVTDRLSPKAQCIYITPPNKNIVVENGVLRLVDPLKEMVVPKPSVDLFFGSLAFEKGKHAIGIILSGTGSDGAKGVRDISEHGGIAIAQDALTAKYSGMPAAALESGIVDLVMSPEELAAQFSNIAREPRDLDALQASPIDLDNVTELNQILHDRTKVNFKHYKTATFQRRVDRRMAALQVASLDDYVAIARNDPTEVDALFGDLLISVTSFFRDPVEFAALKKHIEQIVSSKKDRNIRVWVPGTATGEEAYSIAILFAEAFQAHNRSLDSFQIFATDLDANAIEVARRGFYASTALDEVSKDYIDTYFDKAPNGYTVKKILREKIVFSVHNVAHDPPFLKLDLISCRNLLIYFQATLQAEVFTRFHYALVPHGVLFLGKSEAVNASEAMFKPAAPEKHIFYQRPSQPSKAPRDAFVRRPVFKEQTKPPTTQEQRLLSIAKSRFDSLVASIGPNAVLVDSDMRVLHAYGDVSAYVGIFSGEVSTTVNSLLREPFRREVLASAPGVLRTQTTSRGVTLTDGQDPKFKHRIVIYPIMGDDDEKQLLVTFSSWEVEDLPDKTTDQTPFGLQKQISELQQELDVAREGLQETSEELQTSNEELQALNEELQSSNEELQSTNEELETSNEELQSTNEELSTVNEELQVNSIQLNTANQNLQSILNNIGIPMLVVDCDLRITHASKISEEFFGISPDLDLPHISRCRIGSMYPDLVGLLNKAMDLGQRHDVHIEIDGDTATMSVVPHFSAPGEMVGAIVLLSDDTDELKRTRNELQIIFDNVPVSLMVRDKNGKIIKANATAQKLLGDTFSEKSDQSYYDFIDGENLSELRDADRKALNSGKALLGDVRQLQFKNGTQIWARMDYIPAQHPEMDEPVIYDLTQDITNQYQVEEALRINKERLDQAVAAANIGFWEWDVKTDELFWSDNLLNIVGLTRKKFGGTVSDFMNRLHPEDAAHIEKAAQAHLKKKVPYAVAHRIKKEDGKYVWIESRGQATWDDKGNAIKFVGTSNDVTSAREQVLALRERNEQMALAEKLSGVGYWKLDLQSDELFWSDEVYTMHQVSPKEFTPTLEKTLAFYDKQDLEIVKKHFKLAKKNGTPFEYEARILSDEFRPRIIHAVGSPDRNSNGDVIAIFGVFQDVTIDRQREDQLKNTLEELSRSNEELNRFSYVCSHDMKEPVRMIEAMAELLLDPSSDLEAESRSDLLTRISNNTSRLRAIIDSLLAYSRIDAKVESASVDLNAVLTEIQEGFSLAIKEKNAKLDVGLFPEVTGARIHFTQLFQNLIGNALKFCDNKNPVIRVSAHQSNGHWRFDVEDNGPGIPAESRDDIFNLFSRLNRQDEVEGSGLGLSIAQKIVSQYRGSIKCRESKLGGARFEISMPVEVSSNAN